MNYVYNIHLNFNKIYFDFYEWNLKDEIIHIKKIPIIRTNTNIFKSIVSNKIKLSSSWLKQIKKKTEIINQSYKLTCLILTDNKNICAIKFDSNGNKIMMSSFNLEEEYNILHASHKLKETDLDFKIIKKIQYTFETRKELIQKKFLLKTISTLPFDTLKYIYYECYDKEENNIKVIVNNLIKEIHNNNFLLSNKIYNILNPISTN